MEESPNTGEEIGREEKIQIEMEEGNKDEKGEGKRRKI